MIDSHIHLSDERYSEDLEKVISDSIESGIEKVVLIGCDEKSIKQSIKLKKKFPNFMELVVGWHPVDAKDFSENMLQLIKETTESEKVIAIGEIGLDYHWYPEEKQKQIEIFKLQIEYAKERNLPIIIHCREAYEDCLEILESYAPLSGIMHSFAGNLDILDRVLKVGLDIGISGPITFKNGYEQKEAVKSCPISRIHLETDGPYLTPVPNRGKRNEPKNIIYIAQEIAYQKDVSLDFVIEECTKNTKKLFNIGGN